MTTPHVYEAIAGVMAELSKEGIAKTRRTEGGGPRYNFRGIDDVYNALAPILAANKLVITPRCIARECVERRSNSGGALFYVTVQAEFTLASAQDGSNVTACTYGEALDSGDKATNKAMSAAYKYMAMQTFCIPTEGDNDADATTHVVAPSQARQAAPRNGAQEVVREQLEASVDALKRSPNGRLIPAEAKRQKIHEPLIARIDGADNAELDEIVATFAEITKDHPEGWLDGYRDRIRLRRDELAGVSDAEIEAEETFRQTIGPSPASLSGRDRQPEGVA